MIEKLVSTSAVEGFFISGHYGSDARKGQSLLILERKFFSLVSVGIAKNDNVTKVKVETCLGCHLSDRPGDSFVSKNVKTIYVQPNQWILISDKFLEGELIKVLTESAPEAAVVDISHGRTIFRLVGSSARHVLSKGCSVDLHPTKFLPGSAITTLVGHFTVLLDCIELETIDIYITRSYGLAFLDWLKMSTEEFGFRLGK